MSSNFRASPKKPTNGSKPIFPVLRLILTVVLVAVGGYAGYRYFYPDVSPPGGILSAKKGRLIELSGVEAEVLSAQVTPERIRPGQLVDFSARYRIEGFQGGETAEMTEEIRAAVEMSETKRGTIGALTERTRLQTGSGVESAGHDEIKRGENKTISPSGASSSVSPVEVVGPLASEKGAGQVTMRPLPPETESLPHSDDTQPHSPAAAGQNQAQDQEYGGPKTGTLVWIGQTRKGMELVIEENRASAGTLRGSLPGVPCLVRLSDSRVAVAEAPGPFNRYRRMVLRFNRKGKLALSISWEVLR